MVCAGRARPTRVPDRASRFPGRAPRISITAATSSSRSEAVYQFEVHASSPATPSDVWAVLVDSLRWPDWTALPTPTMEHEGEPAPYGLGAIRRFAWGPVGAKEEV